FMDAAPTGRNAGTYVTTPDLWSGQQGYDIAFAQGKRTVKSEIVPALLLLSPDIDSKTYDGTTKSTAQALALGLKGSDKAIVHQAFDSPHAGARGLVIDSYTIEDGNGGANYRIVAARAPGSIEPRALAIRATEDSKVYDGTSVSSKAPQF